MTWYAFGYVAVSITWAPAAAQLDVGPSLMAETSGGAVEFTPLLLSYSSDGEPQWSLSSGLRAWPRIAGPR